SQFKLFYWGQGMKEQLREAGLTANESKIYVTLLELGPSHAGIISRKSGLHRRVVYDTIEMLVQKGLIGYIVQNNVKLFQVAHPKRMVEMLQEREKVIEEVMPAMVDLYTKTKDKEETNFYTGKNGLKTVFEDQLAIGKEILILGASPAAYDILQFYFHWFDKRRAERKVPARIIFNRDGHTGGRIPYSEIRYLPQKYSSPLAVNIYGKKVALILWSKERPIAIVIKNKEIAEGYRKYFELMWKVAKA
ncbi:MAG: helix-turn-helix domain-containing protein, partial [Clostridiales bacterium]|nr:helix-turn-helix domain-containing protein [Clostridiales bacterium]